MANYTPNLNLRKPLTTEKYDVVADLNDTKDKIDNHAGAVNAQLAQKASQADLNVTEARIDNLIATAGDGTVPSELTDIRVGADAVTYPTAGAAVRDQFSAVNAKMAENENRIQVYNKNIYVYPDHFVSDSYVNSVSGLIQNAVGWGIAKVPVSGTSQLSIYRPSYSEYDVVAFYDESSTPISLVKDFDYSNTYNGKSYITVSVPENAVYVVFTVKRPASSGIEYDDSNSIIVNKGSTVNNEPSISIEDLPVLLEKDFNAQMADIENRIQVYNKNIYVYPDHFINDSLVNSVSGLIQTAVGWGIAKVPVSGTSQLSIYRPSYSEYDVVAFYDESSTPISLVKDFDYSNTYNGKSYITVSVPENAVYVVFTVKRPASSGIEYDDSNSIIVNKGSTVNDTLIIIDGVPVILDTPAPQQYKDKKWVAFGDSLTEINIRSSKFYHQYISDELGISVHNMGLSGSGYKKRYDSSNAFYDRILSTPTDSDVITIFGSFNDLTAGVPLGTAEDTGTDTLGGSINTTFDNLYSILPTVPLGVISPTPWMLADLNDENNEYTMYVRLLEEICRRRGIPFLNLYFSSGLRPWDSNYRTLMYSKDNGNGTHPDENGHKLIYPQIREFLKKLI